MLTDMFPLLPQGMSGVILAGGRSSRLQTSSVHGSNKAFLSVEGQPLIANIVHKLSSLSQDLIIVTNDPTPYAPLALPARLVADEEPGQGALMGIYSGLRVARCPYALVVACDMPFLNVLLLRYMLSLADGFDVVVPQIGPWMEPLHAVYGKACLPAMARLLQQGERQVIAFFPEVRVRHVEEEEIDRFDPLHLSFVNVNTPADWERTQSLLSKERGSQALAQGRQATEGSEKQEI